MNGKVSHDLMELAAQARTIANSLEGLAAEAKQLRPDDLFVDGLIHTIRQAIKTINSMSHAVEVTVAGTNEASPDDRNTNPGS